MNITIFVEPKGKARARTVSKEGGKTWVYTPTATAHAENIIRDRVMQCKEFYGTEVPIRLKAIFYLERPKTTPKKRVYPVVRPDWDNLAKLLTDSLEKFIYKNDAQIVDCYIQKRYGFPPRIELNIEQLG